MKLKFLFFVLCILGAFCSALADETSSAVGTKINASGKLEYVDYPEKSFGNASPVVIITKQVVNDYQCIPAPGNPPTGNVRVYCDSGTGNFTCLTSSGASCISTASGTVTNIATTSPITGGPITSTGTVACATCATASGLTTNKIPKINSSPTLADSSIIDDGLTVSTTEAIVTTSTIASGPSPPTCTAGSAGGACYTEGTAPTPIASVDDLHADSTSHTLTVNNNNTGEMPLSRTLCVNVTPVTVAANTTNDQNLQACTISANALNVVGHVLKVRTAGVFSTAAASTASLTFKIKLCTVSGCGSGTVITPLSATTGATAALSATNLQWLEDGMIVTQTAGASSAYEAQGSLTIDISATATVSEAVYPAVNTGTVGTIDATGGLFIQTTVAASAGSTSNSFTGRQLIVEIVN